MERATGDRIQESGVQELQKGKACRHKCKANAWVESTANIAEFLTDQMRKPEPNADAKLAAPFCNS